MKMCFRGKFISSDKVICEQIVWTYLKRKIPVEKPV